jgi:hypothetical protein
MLIRSSLVKPHDSVIPAKAGTQEKQRKTRFPLKDYWNDRNISHVLLLMNSLVISIVKKVYHYIYMFASLI